MNDDLCALLKVWNGPRVGIFQEHLASNWIQTDAKISSVFNVAIISASKVLTHIVCNHESDVKYIHDLGIRLPVIFLPFCADLTVFLQQRQYFERDKRAFFRGKRLEFMGGSPYADRERIAEFLQNRPETLVLELAPRELLDKNEMIKSYVDDLNSYRIQLNLPSVSSSLTCRPFEVMACGGLLLQEAPSGEISDKIFPKEYYGIFDRKHPEHLLNLIKYYQAHQSEASLMASAGRKHVTRFHSAKIRVNQLLDWVQGRRKDTEIYAELIQRIPEGLAVDKLRHFNSKINLQLRGKKPYILVDLVFYQFASSGIAKVWDRLLRSWIEMGLSKYFVLAMRENSLFAPPDSVIEHYTCFKIPAHGGENDETLLQEACDRVNATLFISTYYTKPLCTPSLLLMHDCIPERINEDFFADNQWAEKREAINYASGYLCISHATSDDVRKYYAETVATKPIYVSHNNFSPQLTTIPKETVQSFCLRHSISERYLLFSGERRGYFGYKNVKAVCHALKELAHLRPEYPLQYQLVFIGGADFNDDFTIEAELDQYLPQWQIRRLSIADWEIPAVYSGAAVTIYPSLHEGFGLPPGESLLCGTPVIAWPTPVNDEYYRDLLIYFTPDTPQSLAYQLAKVLDDLPTHKKAALNGRETLIEKSISRGKSTQAGTFAECLLLHAQLSLEVDSPTYQPVLFDACLEERRDWLQRLVFSHPDEVTGAGVRLGMEDLRSAAIVSIYNGPDFVLGCIADLLRQSEYKSGQMEIILIDSCSPGGEREMIIEMMRSNPRILYLRTLERESLYRAWNRGARGARARYLSNANLDDRHRIDFFERLSGMLDENENIQLVYPGQYLTTIPNEFFNDHIPTRSWGWPEYSLKQLCIGNHVGSQPMWRRSVHGKIGWFEERFRIAGDYEFWCRIAHRVGPLKLYPEHLGLYYFNGVGIEHAEPLRSESEVAEICRHYGIAQNYITSLEDQNRDYTENVSHAPRKLEDLQYSGVPFIGHINVVIDGREGIEQALHVAHSVLSQTVTINHYVQVTVINHRWFTSELNSINSERLQNLTSQIRAASRETLNSYLRPNFCSILVFKQLIDRCCLENSIRELYRRDDIRKEKLTSEDGDLVGVIGKIWDDIADDAAGFYELS